jgi:hypothetical protein
MGSEHAIPEDLQELYAAAQSWRHYHGSEPYFGSGKVEVLIERIAVLEAALRKIADHRTQLPWRACADIAREALDEE